MTQTHYSSRSMVQLYQRCRRARYLANYEGPQGIGLEPRRKSLHLVVGSAVHAGLEVLLRDGQQFYDKWMAQFGNYPDAATEVWAQGPQWREIEDKAVEAALADFSSEFGSGVELDPDEVAAGQGFAAGTSDNLVQITGLDILKGQLRGSLQQAQEDSPIVIDFGDLGSSATSPHSSPSSLPASNAEESGSAAVTTMTAVGSGTLSSVSPVETAEEYLRKELESLGEGMVRAWARRRWRQLLTDFEVIEVEREGVWKLADIDLEPDPDCPRCLGHGAHAITGMVTDWGKSQSVMCECTKGQVHFQSRHDALLLERSTSYLYLQSFKTTGTWDRRKEMDAQVDMQGLSEGVDVERRFEEAWHELQKMRWLVENPGQSHPDGPVRLSRLTEITNERTREWLRGLPDPPKILGVRYEYLLKGMRKKDQRSGSPTFDRYVQESPLCRAYSQEGITSEDRRWAWTYEWQDGSGKSRRLDYRSWHKTAVWQRMTVAEWVDKLDRREVQEEALGDQGEPLDALGSVFVPVVTVFRSGDEVLDLFEQLESQEVQIVKDVEEVRRAEREGGAGAKRSALNRMFPQTRTACSYPGLCSYRTTATQAGFCFGASDPFNDSMVLERFRDREPNHPMETGQ